MSTQTPRAPIETRYATEGDLSALNALYPRAPRGWLGHVVALGECIFGGLGAPAAAPSGLLCYTTLWGRAPLMELIFVEEAARGQGLGVEMLAHWQSIVRAGGATALLSSATFDEAEPQTWHAQRGFRPCGRLDIGGPVPEIFFIKEMV